MKIRISQSPIALFAVALLIIAGASTAANAGDDPSIKGELRTSITGAMNQFIQGATVGNHYSLYDSADGKLLRLKFDKLHSGIVKKGDFYVSCADFTDQAGRKIDVDFLVVTTDSGPKATQALVHAVDGTKRAYHLE
jgi:hypothetical protein